MKQFPAIDVRADDGEMVYARLDDFAPTAIEEREDGLRAFFSSASARDTALAALAAHYPAAPIDVPDDDWARRSQENLTPVTVGRVTIQPAPSTREQHPAPNTQHPAPSVPIVIVVEPSMGFGTGHHATTRLCLAALQDVDVRGKTMVDVGTGSGVLAIAADRLGAAHAIGIDVDEDAIHSARENLALNPETSHVSFAIADVASADLGDVDVITANLTGALLERSAARLVGALRPGGILIASGLMAAERDAVVRACAPASVIWERREDEWVGLAMKKS
jgi:ribosomal protein L11 methyltransferase